MDAPHQDLIAVDFTPPVPSAQAEAAAWLGFRRCAVMMSIVDGHRVDRMFMAPWLHDEGDLPEPPPPDPAIAERVAERVAELSELLPPRNIEDLVEDLDAARAREDSAHALTFLVREEVLRLQGVLDDISEALGHLVATCEQHHTSLPEPVRHSLTALVTAATSEWPPSQR